MASALPSCQRVGAGQAWAHQLPQLPHQLPKPLGKAWDGPRQAGSVAVCRGGRGGAGPLGSAPQRQVLALSHGPGIGEWREGRTHPGKAGSRAGRLHLSGEDQGRALWEAAGSAAQGCPLPPAQPRVGQAPETPSCVHSSTYKSAHMAHQHKRSLLALIRLHGW